MAEEAGRGSVEVIRVRALLGWALMIAASCVFWWLALFVIGPRLLAP